MGGHLHRYVALLHRYRPAIHRQPVPLEPQVRHLHSIARSRRAPAQVYRLRRPLDSARRLAEAFAALLERPPLSVLALEAIPLSVHRAADLREHPLGIRLGARGHLRGLAGGGLELRHGAREHGRALDFAPLHRLQMLRLLTIALLQALQERLELAPLRRRSEER